VTFEIEIAGRTRTVSIERWGDEPGGYRVSVDGCARHVDVRRVGEFSLSLLVEMGTATISAGGRAEMVAVPISREVVVAPGTARGEVLVTLGGRTLAATVNARRTGAAAEGSAHGHGEQVVVAPMPGRIVRVLVTPGDEVAARQAVIVVEAMKMENELRSPKAGRVKDVLVTAGTSVEAGRALIVIE
jgi:biotin carboxyl carrier protein